MNKGKVGLCLSIGFGIEIFLSIKKSFILRLSLQIEINSDDDIIGYIPLSLNLSIFLAKTNNSVSIVGIIILTFLTEQIFSKSSI